MKIGMEFKGMDRMIKGLKKSEKKVPKLADKFSDEAIEVAYDYMERNVPYDTGELAESIEKTVEGTTKSVEVGAEYALAVEYGTHRQSAQPFIRPANQKMEEFIEKNAGGVVDDAF